MKASAVRVMLAAGEGYQVLETSAHCMSRLACRQPGRLAHLIEAALLHLLLHDIPLYILGSVQLLASFLTNDRVCMEIYRGRQRQTMDGQREGRGSDKRRAGCTADVDPASSGSTLK